MIFILQYTFQILCCDHRSQFLTFFFWHFFDAQIFLLSDEWSWSLCTLHAFWMCEELAKHQGSTSTPTSSSKRFLASEGEVWRQHALHAPGKLWFILFATCRRLTRNVILWKQSYEYIWILWIWICDLNMPTSMDTAFFAQSLSCDFVKVNWAASEAQEVPLCVIDLACKT